ncbi:MAG: hypothetical protein GXP08_03970 [Gammaproteobacteria bacterium]|nr:hypothetical protein [Gammaproteobacteria bacterium]
MMKNDGIMEPQSISVAQRTMLPKLYTNSIFIDMPQTNRYGFSRNNILNATVKWPFTLTENEPPPLNTKIKSTLLLSVMRNRSTNRTPCTALKYQVKKQAPTYVILQPLPFTVQDFIKKYRCAPDKPCINSATPSALILATNNFYGFLANVPITPEISV